MPSLHFSWTIMLGILFLRTPRMWIKVLGVLYPALTLVAITVTANHYIMDAIGGALLIGASFAVLELVIKRRLFLPGAVERLRLRLHRRRIPRERTESQGNLLPDGATVGNRNSGQTPAGQPTADLQRRSGPVL